MKHLRLAGALALALGMAGTADAADLATKYPVKAVAAPAFTWTGFYVGGNVGYGWGDTASSGEVASYLGFYYDTLVSSGGLSPTGWFGGVQAGYNYQFSNNVVLGIEADFDWGNLSDDGTYTGTYYSTPNRTTVTDTGALSSKIDWFGTARIRLGYAFDRFLPYVTGGLAWAHVKYGETFAADQILPGNTSFASWTTDETRFGWTIGAGAEYAITDHWSAKLEYLYADLGSVDYDPGLGYSNQSFGVTLQTLKLGVNYKF